MATSPDTPSAPAALVPPPVADASLSRPAPGAAGQDPGRGADLDDDHGADLAHAHVDAQAAADCHEAANVGDPLADSRLCRGVLGR